MFIAVARPTLSVDWHLAIRSRRPKCRATACKSVEMESIPTFRQSHGTLGVANEWPSSRSTASVAVSQPRQSHTSDQLRHTMHSPPCLNLYLETRCLYHAGMIVAVKVKNSISSSIPVESIAWKNVSSDKESERLAHTYSSFYGATQLC